jgi:hypothetical protein
MHRHGRLWRVSTERRRIIGEAVADTLLLIPVIALFVFSPAGHWGPAWEVILVVGALAVTSMVRFEVGSGSTAPTQLMIVPLWFAVPPCWITPLFGLSLVMGGVIEQLREPSDQPIWRRVFHAGDAWPMVGPSVVLALAGAPEVSVASAWVVAIAFAGQLLVDCIFGLATPWFMHGLRPKTQSRILFWIYGVDTALAPIGFLVALVARDHPAAVVAVLPLVGVIGEFARERRERLDQALQLSAAYRGTAQLMGDVLEADDAYTGGEHTQGVVDMAIAVGLELRLDPRDMRDLEFGALLHDIGKLRIPNEIINKPGALDDAEWKVIREHPIYGQQMLDRVGGAMTAAGRIVRAHHERWDGQGYPDRLRDSDIPLAARIITVCDSFSAMTTKRAYSPAKTRAEGLAELDRCSGTQFDPAIVDALNRVLVKHPELSGVQTSERFTRTPAAAAALGLRSLA